MPINKLWFVALVTLFAVSAHAQNTFPASGNVGIATTSPSDTLQIDNGNVVLWKHSYAYPVSSGTYYGPRISFSQWSNAPSTAGSSEIGNIANTAWSHGFLASGGLYFSTSQQDSQPAVRMIIDNVGNVGIGTTSPSATLEVNGNVKLTSGSGASMAFADGTVQSTAWNGTLGGGDYAESVDVTGGSKKYEPGDILAIDPKIEGSFAKSAEPYSTSVMGIYSTKPGLVGRRQLTPKTLDEIPMAMMGIVPAKVSAENGPIHPGDLLVTSSIPGYAMKGTDRSKMVGALVGKAMGNIESGTGVIEIAVTLQ